MSNSYRKIPIIGFAASSDAWYKRLHSKQERARVRELIAHGRFDLLQFQQVRYNDWASCKDGKQWFDPDEKPKLMRK